MCLFHICDSVILPLFLLLAPLSMGAVSIGAYHSPHVQSVSIAAGSSGSSPAEAQARMIRVDDGKRGLSVS